MEQLPKRLECVKFDTQNIEYLVSDAVPQPKWMIEKSRREFGTSN